MKKLRTVLSLFDGMSCGQIALVELGVEFDKYYASEIDANAINHTQANFPTTIQLGDVEKWREWDIDWSSVDLILAGSPCQGFSLVGKQLNFNDPRSKLFWVFVEILEYTKTKNPSVLFLLENVRMREQYVSIISNAVRVYPICINSNLVSAQHRIRYYWTNIRTKYNHGLGIDIVDIPQPEDRSIFIKDILDYDENRRYLTKYDNRGYILKSDRRVYSEKYKANGFVMLPTAKAFPVTCGHGELGTKTLVNNRVCMFTIRELLRLQTIPDWYSFTITKFNPATKLIGNAWTVEVIKHILSYLP